MIKCNVLHLLLAISILVSTSGCSSSAPMAQPEATPHEEKTVQPPNAPTPSTQSSSTETPAAVPTATALPKPPFTLEEILAYQGEVGRFSGSSYNESALKAELDKLPEGMTEEEIYAYILQLVGENYQEEKRTFDELEKVNYRQALLSIDPSAPAPSQQTKAKMNVEVILDASGSMAEKVNGGVKMDLAKKSIQDFLGNLPNHANVGLRVFGHKGSGADKDKLLSCSQTELIYPLSGYNPNSFQSSLQRFGPKGWTGIATALEAAQQDLQNSYREGMENIIYLVTDAKETCGGNPVEVAKLLHESEIKAVINLIGFDVDDEAQRQLKAVAEAGGGTYTTVKDKRDMENVFQQYLKNLYEENRNWMQKAVDNVWNEYEKDENELIATQKAMLQKTAVEYERLQAAADYLREKGVLNKPQWLNIVSWMDDRWLNLSDYADDRWISIGHKMDVEWMEAAAEVEHRWMENGRELDQKSGKVALRIGNLRAPKIRIAPLRTRPIRF
ncbi:VWA domain-containing protein [Brevibacillus sp. SYP-B805]|uniref:VWA domain-containing protein n=1 Tax=Brevibacillus sp. SYP-B805 TaxID=1578199 RepID=UPI0013EDC705|nr:VWA domain-containing protein [Brevibacillus sp. SYP-B805]NGQ95117.1 VWA domain-containing protein [Brevibacillus sp. SYP-B805]